MRLGKGIPKLSLPGSKPSGKVDTKPGGKPDSKPTFSPRPNINGNVPGKKPGSSLDDFTPGSGLDKLKPKGFGGLGDVLGGGLSAVGDVMGGVASGAAGVVGAGVEAALMLPGAMGMMAPMMAEPAAKVEPKKSSRVPSADDKRPEGDTRSAKEIVEDTPVLANLGRQKDIKWNDLCRQTGVDPNLDIKDAKQNPDAVYRLAKVLEFIDSARSADGGDRSNKVQNGKGDGNIEGLTKDGDARHGTEAGMVKDFAEQGYSFLGEHQLPTTNDTHVKPDGSNKDNFQWFAGEAGKHLWFLPGVSNVLTGIGNSEGGVGGVFKGAAEGVLQTWKGAAEGVIGAFTKGRINPASLLFGAYTGALSQTEAAPQPVKDIASLF